MIIFNQLILSYSTTYITSNNHTTIPTTTTTYYILAISSPYNYPYLLIILFKFLILLWYILHILSPTLLLIISLFKEYIVLRYTSLLSLNNYSLTILLLLLLTHALPLLCYLLYTNTAVNTLLLLYILYIPRMYYSSTTL